VKMVLLCEFAFIYSLMMESKGMARKWCYTNPRGEQCFSLAVYTCTCNSLAQCDTVFT